MRKRPAGQLHARAPPAARPARRAAAGRDPGRALGDRPRERLAAEHHPQPARRSFRIRRVLERERFDVLHLHEPMTPTPAVAALAVARCPLVATFHASGELGWLQARASRCGGSCSTGSTTGSPSPSRRASRPPAGFPGDYELVPNGVLIPERGRSRRAARTRSSSSAGRSPRKGLHVLLRAWPEIHRRTGARLRLIGADPLAVRLLLRAHCASERGHRRARLPLAGAS